MGINEAEIETQVLVAPRYEAPSREVLRLLLLLLVVPSGECNNYIKVPGEVAHSKSPGREFDIMVMEMLLISLASG